MERPLPFIGRVRLKNYKSIARCDVRLDPLTVLTGPNGSGKSNFLQALALLGRAVSTTPHDAIAEFGGLGEILRRAPEQVESFSIDIEATLPPDRRESRVLRSVTDSRSALPVAGRVLLRCSGRAARCAVEGKVGALTWIAAPCTTRRPDSPCPASGLTACTCRQRVPVLPSRPWRRP
jgi:energy-coupling factor transporter ATP-binding protein EcfA2